VAIEADLTGIRAAQTAHEIEDGRLTATAPTDQSDETPAGNGPVCIVQNDALIPGSGAVSLEDVMEFDHEPGTLIPLFCIPLSLAGE
jgi:hypothetical protein